MRGKGGFCVGESCPFRSVRGVAKREWGQPFYGACEEVQEAKGSSLQKFSLQGANFCYCSENFDPAPALLLQNKNKNKNKRTEYIKEDFN